MNNRLLKLVANNIATGLKRKSITSCSRYAEMYRIMGQPFPGKWTFDHHPWLIDMHNCDAYMIAGQKAAQMGFTEAALNKVFYNIDIHGISCLYILPTSHPDASVFSTSRFDPALEMSKHLNSLFSDVKNIGHKRAGNANLYVRGSRSRSQMKSLPVGFMIFDEVDEMVQDNVVLAFERMSGQVQKQAFLISTPTIDNFGINSYYGQSTKNHYFFKCPHCGKRTELIFPDCLIITGETITDINIMKSHLICKECKGVLKHNEKISWLNKDNCLWVPEYHDRLITGFHISQLYSPTVAPYELAKSVVKAQTNLAEEQELYNSKLGLTRIVEGAKVTDTQINDCTGSFKKVATHRDSSYFVTMGVDVGKALHYEIDQWYFNPEAPTNDINLLSVCRILSEGKKIHFEELDDLMKVYNVNFCVVDANPEKRKAMEFAARFYGYIKLCYYGNNLAKSKEINIHPEEEQTITVDRTSWLDVSLGRFFANKIHLPIDLSTEYKNHVKALVRVYEKDVNDNPVSRYVKGNEDDHFAHARNYSEIALQLGVSLGSSYDIRSNL